MNIDIEAYLQDRGFDFSTSGKNTTEGWVNVQCPFPACGDGSNHCGISRESDMFSCWKCGESGHISYLISELEGCSVRKAKQIMEKYPDDSLEIEPEPDHFLGEVLLKEFSDKFPEKYLKYLKSRRFNPEELIQKYYLKAAPNFGKYKFRIIIPIFLNNQIVSFTAMSVTKSVPKYLHCEKNKSKAPINNLLYGIDEVEKSCILVEGITDVWRIGSGAVAIFGTNMTDNQIDLLLSKGIDNITILLDSDASNKGKKLAENLSMLFASVSFLELDDGDPDDLPEEEVKSLRKIIFDN